ncbi:MAG: hypothetical protein QM692_18030 [Thermomicrobiales bacterium]
MLAASGVGLLASTLLAPLAEAGSAGPVAPGWLTYAQATDTAAPSQTGEANGDAENLDQGAPPAANGDDVETLDQGSPPAAVDVAAPVSSAPAPTGTAYSEPAGPQLPPGFGEGRVFVSNNPRGVPVGLEPCEVGVVTGRAYVGIKCGEDGASAVGHASGDDDFPWVVDPGFPFQPGAAVVTDPSFPFDEDSPFFESFLDRTTDDDVVVLVAPRQMPGSDGDETTVDGGTVVLAQPVVERAVSTSNRTRTQGSATAGDVSTAAGADGEQRSVNAKQRATGSNDRKSSKRAKRKAAKSTSQQSSKSGKSNKSGKAKSGKKSRNKSAKVTKKQRAKESKRERNRERRANRNS